jgi:hypothetical protein
MRRVILLVTLFAMLALPVSAGASAAQHQKVVFAHGTNPEGERWKGSAGIRLIRGRHVWLFTTDFEFSDGFGEETAQEIPVGGRRHVEGEADGYTGLLTAEGSEGAAFGIAGPEIVTIKAKMSDGSHLELHPIFPPQELRKKYVWMRGFRYFVQFYPGRAHVVEYSLYDESGKRTCRSPAEEGLFRSIACAKLIERSSSRMR